MAELKSIYLVHGDDEVKLDEWRKRLRARARSENATLELIPSDGLDPDALIAATRAMTLAVGRRYVLAEGVEKLKDADAARVGAALADLDPDTVVVMLSGGKIAKGKGPAPAKLVKAVEKHGGEVHLCATPATGSLPAWIVKRADEAGKTIGRETASLLVERAPRDRGKVRQQTLMRELEKLVCYVGERDRIEAEDVEAVAASEVDARAFYLAGALIAGDTERALRIAEELRESGEDPMPILFTLRSKLRDARHAWSAVESGMSLQDVQAALRVPPWIAKQLVAEARGADGQLLERAVAALADWDWSIRGGSDHDAWTALTLAIEQIAAPANRAAA